MQFVKIVVWEEGGAWLGYLTDDPDSRTQGASLEDLREHLRDPYTDPTSGTIVDPPPRKQPC